MRLRRLAIAYLLSCIMLVGCSFSKAESAVEVQPLAYDSVYFNISEDKYYPVRIPEGIQYITDNAKYIYSSADEDSLNVSVVSGADPYNFSTSTLVKDAESLQQNIIVTKNWETAEVAEAAVYLMDDKAVRVHVERNPEVFATILSGLQNEIVIKSKYTCLRLPDLEEDEEYAMPVYKGTPEVSAGLGTDIRKVYSLEDGNSSLSISRELRKYEEAILLYEQRMATVAGTDIAKYYYKTDNVFYAEVEDYVVGIYKINFNTVLTCYGYGDAAKLNTIFFLNNQE